MWGKKERLWVQKRGVGWGALLLSLEGFVGRLIRNPDEISKGQGEGEGEGEGKVKG
jgi:hypothetical protein